MIGWFYLDIFLCICMHCVFLTVDRVTYIHLIWDLILLVVLMIHSFQTILPSLFEAFSLAVQLMGSLSKTRLQLILCLTTAFSGHHSKQCFVLNFIKVRIVLILIFYG